MTYLYSPDVLRLNPPPAGGNCSKISNSSTGRKPTLPHETESDFMSWVIDYAHFQGWLCAHFRGAWSKDGKRFMTPVSADGSGWPDLCLVRGGVIIFAELKSAGGKVREEQTAWLKELARNPLVRCYVWRPGDRESIMRILAR